MKRIIFLLTFIFAALGITQETGARYLIITHDNFYDAILPYALWKHKMGLRTKIIRVPSELAQNSTAIRNYIVNAYNSWQIRPEFILFVGAPNYIPWSMTSPYSDNNYTNMDTPIENEILSGRLTVHNLTEAQTVVNKMLLYERYPDTTNTDWFINACLIVREDYESYSDSIYWSDIHHAKSLMMNNEFHIIDTLSRAQGNNANNVISSVNNGRGFVLYRGQGVGYWWDPFNVNPDLTQNGKKLPIVLSITCQTIGSGSTPATAEKWLLTGNPTSPRGGAGYFATTTIVSHQAYLRSAVCKGFFDALFLNKRQRFGEACENGRLNVYRLYGSTTEYRGFTTLGDPAMLIWTAKPKSIAVFYDSILQAGVEETLKVNVQYQGAPIESACVCIMLDTLIYQTNYTNSNGEVTFIFTAPVPGSMDVTVTGKNLYPFEGTIQITNGNIYLQYLGNTISDSLGNNNGIINPGETILLIPIIRNTGSVPANDVTAHLRSADTTVNISDSVSFFGNINQGQVLEGLNPFSFSISPNAQTHNIPFDIVLIDAQGDTFSSNFSLIVISQGSATGPDPYGYYIYDDTDTSTGNAPVYDWFEIAPPGPGTIISEITDEDADTVTYSLPFTFKYYGIEYNSIGICSNGFLELGNSTYRFGENTAIPASGGPKRLIAPFWDDLDPRPAPTGYGDIYHYNDTTNHRWIVEYKECGHYGNSSSRETFQAILLDPMYYPTPTGDGEIIFLYNTVANATENSLGIEDETETRGLQYLYNNSYEPNAVPLLNNRALLITTKPPYSQHSPWINLVNYILSDSAGGNNNGIPEPNEIIEIVLYIRNDGDTMVTNVNGIIRTTSSSIFLMDSTADFGNIDIGAVSDNSSNPYVIQIAQDPVDTLVGLAVCFTGNGGGYQTCTYFTLHIHDETGIMKNSNLTYKNHLLQVYPNPFRNRTIIRYTIQDAGYTMKDVGQGFSLAIYDVTGRTVKQFNHLTNYQSLIIWDGTDDSGRRLPSGVYFIRLEDDEFKKTEKVILLK